MIIGACDLMVTPIHDPEWRTWSPDTTLERGAGKLGALSEYGAKSFKDYLRRGWCRLEMFFCAHMPFDAARGELFGGEIGRIMVEEKRRPHLLFGTREAERGDMPIILRPLKDEEFRSYHPAEGSLSKDSDKQIINLYVDGLFRINGRLRVRFFMCWLLEESILCGWNSVLFWYIC
jgi:hypothetical protein